MATTHATEDIELAARLLYDAEYALHIANQTRVDAWISAAADRLHDAIVTYDAHCARGRNRHAAVTVSI